MINIIDYLKRMKNAINLNRPGVFCQTQPYDNSDLINDATALKRRGDYVGSFLKYVQLYNEYGKLSLVWVRGAFKTLACAGAVIDAYDLLMACTNSLMRSSDELVLQLRVHQVSIVLCLLGYLGVGGYEQFSLKKYLADLSGNPAYVIPGIDGELNDVTIKVALLSHMNMYNRQYPNLVKMAEFSLLSI